jgi:hypothetical protein
MSELTDGLSEEFHLGKLEKVSFEMDFGEIYCVVAEMIDVWAFRIEIGGLTEVSRAMVDMIRHLMGALFGRFDRKDFPPEFLEVWSAIEKYWVDEGEGPH